MDHMKVRRSISKGLQEGQIMTSMGFSTFVFVGLSFYLKKKKVKILLLPIASIQRQMQSRLNYIPPFLLILKETETFSGALASWP